MAAFLDLCRFVASAGGTTDWTYSSAVSPYISPANAGAANGRAYKVRAESADLTQWEVSEGAYSSAGAGSFARTTVLYNSAGTGTLQSGAGAKINFTLAPQVWVVASKRDLLSIEEANAFTAAQKAQARSNIGAAPMRGYLYGLTLSAAGSTATFGVAAGEAADGTATDLMSLATAYAKTTAAWAVGSGNGALDTGTIAAATWYHVYLIKRPDTGVVDVLISLQPVTPSLPANYTLFRRIGSLLANSSSQWIKFKQVGDEFLFDIRRQDVGTTTCPTSATLHVVSVPPGIQCWARLMLRMDYISGNVGGLITSPDESDQVPGGLTVTMAVTVGSSIATTNVDVRTDTSSQVRVRFTGTTSTYSILTYGYFDHRGRDA